MTETSTTTDTTTPALTPGQREGRLVALSLTALADHIYTQRLPMPLSIESRSTAPTPLVHLNTDQVDTWLDTVDITAQRIGLTVGGYTEYVAVCRLPETGHVVHLLHLVPAPKPGALQVVPS